MKTPAQLRTTAAEYLVKAERASHIAQHAADYAPGSYITGASGRTREQDRKTTSALDKTIKYSKIACYWREKAASLEMKARYIESEPQRTAKRTAQAESDKRERTAKHAATPAERLLCCVFPTGLFYSDTGRERNGDYITLAHISYRTLVLEIEPDCPPDFIKLIEKDAARLKAGELFQVSTCGQTVRLGV
jgi:hypothetical protein